MNFFLQLEAEDFILSAFIVSDLGLIMKDLPKVTSLLSYI
jgi:hypothetical protein